MAFSSGPYTHRSSLPSPPRPEIHSSRKIDFASGRYSLDETTGGNVGMPGVAQRVVLVVSEVTRDAPADIITDSANAEREDKIRKALASLTTGPVPVARLRQVSVESQRAGIVDQVVQFDDLGVWQDERKQLS